MPRIKLIELAMPGPPAPSKKMLLIAVSGIVPIVLYIVVLFVVFYLDDSIKNAKELANKTNIPVLGYLPLLAKLTLNLESIWKESESATPLQAYKDLLRSARFEIAQEMKDGKIVTITSVSDGEGKSFIALSLAYAYKMANKNVLLIDGDFEINSTTEITKAEQYFEDYIYDTLSLNDIVDNDGISILGNRTVGTSLFELKEESLIREKLTQLKSKYDIIIIDATSLDNLNKSKEWIVVADKVLSVFEANQTITNTKQLQINYLTGLNEVFIGWVLNKVATKRSRLSKFISKLKSKGKNRKKKRKKTDD
jgi:Mrp family chromosome partitioning ATPase